MADSAQPSKKNRILADLLRDRILPDLMEKSGARQRQVSRRIGQLQNYQFEHSQIVSFSGFLLDNDISGAIKCVDAHISNGCSAPVLVLDLLCNSARYLGDLWCLDEKSFAEVTIGTAALHQVLRYLDEYLARELVMAAGEGRSILLATMPGDTHIFGVSVLGSFFRCNGWIVETELNASSSKLIELVSGNAFDVVGFSVACDRDIDICKGLVAEVRRRSINKKIKILAGGSSLSRNNDLLTATGADATANGALDALQVASTICANDCLDEIKANHVL